MFNIRVLATGSEAGNCTIISDGWTNVMIDAGIAFNALEHRINALFVTHEHGDHTKYCRDIALKGIRIFATQGTFNKIELPSFAKNVIEYGKQFDIGTLKVIAFPVPHDAAEPCGFFIKNRAGETICFIGDTGALEDINVRADCYIIEMNYDAEALSERLDKGEMYEGLHARLTSEFGHLSVQQAEAWLNENADENAHVIGLHKPSFKLPDNSLVYKLKNFVEPDEKGQIQYQFGVDDRPPF